jgi:hypothetical protein
MKSYGWTNTVLAGEPTSAGIEFVSAMLEMPGYTATSQLYTPDWEDTIVK